MDQEEANPCCDPIKDGIVLDITQRNLGIEINWKIVNKGSIGRAVEYKEPLDLNEEKSHFIKRYVIT